MNIDMVSLAVGIAVGLMLSNLINLMTAYIRRHKARAASKVVQSNLDEMKRHLEARKQVVLDRIKIKQEKK